VRRTRNGTTAAICGAFILFMLALTAASVPLYRIFCAATGFDGTPRIVTERSATIADREVTVFFNADHDPRLPWSFRPMQRSVTVKLGEERLVTFEAINESKVAVVGHAAYNVAPDKSASYFSKLECFCFQNQTLEAGERVEMPVSFFVDPAMLEDPNAREVKQITLSYTFFRDEAATAELARKRAGAAG
jgi:cytochrome c oxidase assembly protein subunit 11